MRRRVTLVLSLLLLGCTAVSQPPPAAAADPAAAARESPGAPPRDADTQRALTAARERRGDGYRPRTRHLEPDGSATYTNRLIRESSPYLLQHAHNPVDWYPWGDAAFAAAAALGRPVLLSIGYSTCHWCHVMEEESFEDLEIAEFINAHYIAIKVDREERPDIDAVYMSAVQLLTGGGGWPMTTWLTPDRQPYFGGTYFPARDGDRGAKTGFLTLLRELKTIYDAQPQGVVEQAARITAEVRKRMELPPGTGLPDAATLDRAVARFREAFDPEEGGTQGAPKFPSNLPLRLLLRQHRRTGDPAALRMVELTLAKMARGGLYDQIGGGFHRYATDARWRIPHFEKMLYDNALLTLAYLEAFQVTGNAEYERVVREVLRYVSREMTDPGGGFYSAADADSLTPAGQREEGWFFTWTPAEIRAALSQEQAAAVEAHYGISAAGNFEGRNILHVVQDLGQTAAALGHPPAPVARLLDEAREALYAARGRRPAPLVDRKILASWNGLMISAFARVGFVLDDAESTRRAIAAARFVTTRMMREGRLARSFSEGGARHNAYLDDHAFLIAGLLDLYEATFDAEWLRQAIGVQALLDKHYADAERGGYFMTSDDHELLLARQKPSYDGAEPSGNSVALMNLLRLHSLTGAAAYDVRARQLLEGFGTRLSRFPASLADMLLAVDFRLAPREIVIVGGSERRELDPFVDALRTAFVPNKVVAVVGGDADAVALATLLPWIEGKVARGGRTTAYVCERGVCSLPTTEAATFLRQLQAVAEPPAASEPVNPPAPKK